MRQNWEETNRAIASCADIVAISISANILLPIFFLVQWMVSIVLVQLPSQIARDYLAADRSAIVRLKFAIIAHERLQFLFVSE